ncbi:MAG TPA: response regulator transcription factor [Anaerolineales bacterium]|nr:response regulator transcription factor [Anaerolineales bacterium]
MMENIEKIKVLIVDDHQVVRQGLRTFLELLDDITVIGEAQDGRQAVELVRTLNPDVVLMDLVMPHMDGITAIEQVRSLRLPTKVIALTSFSEDDKVFPAIQAGAESYLLKDVSPEDLAEAIRAVHRGEARLHPDITRKLMQQVSQIRAESQDNSLNELTEREKEVLRMVAQGSNNREIAQKLFISEKTVKTHVSNILGKLNLEQRTQLVIYAIKNKLVDA